MLHVSKAAAIIDDKTGPRLGHISARTKSGGSLKSPPGCPGIASPSEAKDPPRLKELLDRVSSIQDEKDQLSAPLGQLKEGDQKKNSKLDKERAEVVRLKEELEGLKSQHGKELALATESAKKEVAALKEEHARELAEVKNN
ncbi:hypothetical protein QYE76_019102 [Lolium multiflorum]|uniref:Uncharacterized protein n=1 Tax=Lolium multiflorum TaxID=4521 RepID=A0AAD8R3W4_LOLMU|nr:hypothetical protein QYE76_019102 [Lolium multiflorum]